MFASMRSKYQFGPSGAGHVRISYAADEGRLQEGLSRLGAYVDRLRGGAAGRERRAA